jgi:hypothetical protein
MKEAVVTLEKFINTDSEPETALVSSPAQKTYDVLIEEPDGT